MGKDEVEKRGKIEDFRHASWRRGKTEDQRQGGRREERWGKEWWMKMRKKRERGENENERYAGRTEADKGKRKTMREAGIY